MSAIENGAKVKMEVRTIRIPIAEVLGPLEDNGEITEIDNPKKAFYADLRESLDLARRSYNQVLTSCACEDSEVWSANTMKKEKASKPGKAYFYPQISHNFPGCTNIAASIAREAAAKYRDIRFNMVRGKISLPTQREHPWPVLKGTGFRVYKDQESVAAEIRLLSARWKVRLRGGSNYRIHISRLERIEEKDVRDSKIWIADGKATLGIAFAMKPEERQSTRHMRVASSIDSLLVCTLDNVDRPYVITGDDVRKWLAESNRRKQRTRQDMKTYDSRQHALERLSGIAEKHNNRMNSFIHNTSRRVVDFAKSRNVGNITLDLTAKSYAPSFPWSDLATKIQYKCTDAGINCVVSTQSVEDPDAEMPCVYFAYSPSLSRVKIGQTAKGWNNRMPGGQPTDSPEELILLAIDNQPKAKLVTREKHYHAQFASARIDGTREWFEAATVIRWLREAGWIGNTGNRSQIMQVLEI